MTNRERYALAQARARHTLGILSNLLGDWQDNRGALLLAYKSLDPAGRAERLDVLIDGSAKTKFAWDYLAALSSDMLRNGLELPDPLRLWLADVVDRKRERPNKIPLSTLCRDALAAFLVGRVVRYCEINATRNDGSEPLSACDAVAEALNISYKLIEKAWFEHRDTVS